MQGPASKSLLPTLDIHFTIITNGQPRNTVNYNDPAVLEQMVNLLNQAFVTQSGQRLVNFRYKSTTPYNRAVGRSEACRAIVASGQGIRNTRSEPGFSFPSIYKRCLDDADRSHVLDPNAINVYIFDGWSEGTEKTAADDQTSGGDYNNGYPCVRIDYRRVYENGQWNRWAVFQHEMGHALGLKYHVCNDQPGGTASTPTNIMSSSISGWAPGVQCDPDNA